MLHAFPHGRRLPRVVVLGASGFLGRQLVQVLRDNDTDVVGLGSKDIDLSGENAGERLAALLNEGDALVFLAALTPDKARDSGALMRNLSMGRSVCAAATKTKLSHLIYASSDAVYPFTTALICEETPAAPADLYGVMHRTREILLGQEAPGLLAVLRFTAIFGPGDTHNGYGPNRFVRQAISDKRIGLFGKGEETRDHLFVDDAVALVRAVIVRGSTGVLNVASGHSVTFREAADCVAAATPGVTVACSERKNTVTHRHFDISQALTAFPRLRMTRFADGLAATVAGLTRREGPVVQTTKRGIV